MRTGRFSSRALCSSVPQLACRGCGGFTEVTALRGISPSETARESALLSARQESSRRFISATAPRANDHSHSYPNTKRTSSTSISCNPLRPRLGQAGYYGGQSGVRVGSRPLSSKSPASRGSPLELTTVRFFSQTISDARPQRAKAASEGAVFASPARVANLVPSIDALSQAPVSALALAGSRSAARIFSRTGIRYSL